MSVVGRSTRLVRDNPAERRTRRWALVGLCAYGAVVVAILLLPVSYGGIVNRITTWIHETLGWEVVRSGWVEFGANIAMFVPLGFFLCLIARRPWHGLALAALLSVCAEAAQIVIPSRQPSVRDVVGNVSGAIIGALLAGLVLAAGRRRNRAAGRRIESANEPA